MQTIKIDSVVKWKEGDGNKNGKAYHWISYNLTFPELTIFDQTGTQYKFTKAATFDFLAASLKPGDTIECEAEINDKYLNLKGLKKVGGSLTEAVNTYRENIVQTAIPKPILPKTLSDRDREVDEGKAVDYLIRMVEAKIITPDSTHAKAAINWCTDKLSHYLPPRGSDTPLLANKPSVGGTGDASVDKRLLLGLVKTNMKFPDDKTAISWLVNVQKVPQTRIDTEAVKVYDEVREKQGWE